MVDGGQIEGGQCKLLSAVWNVRMWSWSGENFSLNCLLISISGNEYMDRGLR